MKRSYLFLILPLAICIAENVGTFQSANAVESTWKLPDEVVTRKSVFEWLKKHKPDDAARMKAESLWPIKKDQPLTGDVMLQRTIAIYALLDERVAKLRSHCQNSGANPTRLNIDWVTKPQTDDQLEQRFQSNLTLYYAKWLVHRKLYDELLEVTDSTKPEHVVAPASLLFYRAVAQQRLVQIDACLATISSLLKRKDEIPKRFAAVAALMKADLANAKKDKLGHIARRMDDIGRRLALGRTGKPVIDLENNVIQDLDKLIKEIEKKKQKQQKNARSAAHSSRPQQASRPGTESGPGEVDDTDIGQERGWGALPDRVRQAALQQIGKDFPSHYRKLIIEYFKKLAELERDR